MLLKVVVCRNAVLVIIDSVKQVVVSSQRLLLAVFLEDDEVTAHFRIGIFREQVVGKTNRWHEISMIEHHKTRGTVVFGIQYALWGDEGN